MCQNLELLVLKIILGHLGFLKTYPKRISPPPQGSKNVPQMSVLDPPPIWGTQKSRAHDCAALLNSSSTAAPGEEDQDQASDRWDQDQAPTRPVRASRVQEDGLCSEKAIQLCSSTAAPGEEDQASDCIRLQKIRSREL